MKLSEATTEVRRKMGIILTTESDVGWLCAKVVRDNRKVFDELARK